MTLTALQQLTKTPSCSSHSFIWQYNPYSIHFTLIALMADFVTDIILARDIGGFMSIMENNWWVLTKKKQHLYQCISKEQTLVHNYTENILALFWECTALLIIIYQPNQTPSQG